MMRRKNPTTKILLALVVAFAFAAVFLYVKGITPQEIRSYRVYQTEPYAPQGDGTALLTDPWLYEAKFLTDGEFYIRKTETTDWEYLMQGKWSFVDGSIDAFLLTDRESGRGMVVTIGYDDFYFYDEERGEIKHFIRKN